MNPTANPSTPSSSSQEHDDPHFLEQLAGLAKQRDMLLSTANDLHAPPFHHIMQHARNRLLQVIRLRDSQLSNLRASFQVECQQAADDFERGKKTLRSEMLSLAAERRKRIDAVRTPGVSKKKKRRGHTERHAKRIRQDPTSPYLSSLESQGLLRVAATPDEINQDLAQILHAVESGRLHTPAKFPLDHVSSRPMAEKIQCTKGVLHYHDDVFEKGDRIALYVEGKGGGNVKVVGVIQSLNVKELVIRGDDGSPTKVPVSHIRNGRYSIKHASTLKNVPQS